MTAKPRIGISACLFGHRVRYDGQDKRDNALLDALGDRVELVPVCPETGIGLGVPRPPIQLVSLDDGIRAIGVEDRSIDATDALVAYAGKVLEQHQLDGFIFKSRSPSCGVHDTPVFSNSGEQTGTGRGVFVQAILAHRPDLPVKDELQLQDNGVLAAFIKSLDPG